MLIHSHENGIRYIDYRDKEKGTVAQLMMLIPGVQAVDEKKWSKALELASFKKLVEDETYEVLDVKAEVSLAALAPKQALKLIKDCVERGLLMTWRDAEKRRPVADAIDAQLEAIKFVPPAEKPAQD